jgi:hypothetical protein
MNEARSRTVNWYGRGVGGLCRRNPISLSQHPPPGSGMNKQKHKNLSKRSLCWVGFKPRPCKSDMAARMLNQLGYNSSERGVVGSSHG